MNQLGYKDVIASDTVPDWLLRFFSKTLPKVAADYYNRFTSHRDLLLRYAPTLADRKLSPEHRQDTYRQFYAELIPLPDQEPDDDAEPDY